VSEKKWNIWTGENAPWWATLGMLILWCAVAWKAHVRNNHLVMIFASLGAFWNLNKLLDGSK
jgi:hypothetical protein